MECLHAWRVGPSDRFPRAGGLRGQSAKGTILPPAYFCQVRFLWRLARSFLRRLCLFILLLRRFFNDPIIICSYLRLQYTTLFKGYSIIPSAPAALSWGINSRTTRSSMIVSTATQPARLRLETVGLRKAGRVLRSEARSFSCRFIFNPTLLSASRAPRSRSARVSIFCRFQGSFHDAWLAIRRGVETSNVSTMRSLLARNDEPVSVISTIASTSSCALTSVAPQENSTSALTPCRRR